MAARENQGLQIALIIFVMLTIVLIVTTYLFFSNYSDQRDKAKALAQDNSDKDTKMRQAIAETDDLKNLVGAAFARGSWIPLALTGAAGRAPCDGVRPPPSSSRHPGSP